MKRKELFAELRRRGAARAEVEFSGGGDEGGVDLVVLYDAAGDEIASLAESYAEQPDAQTATDNALLAALSAPVEHKYGDFDGDGQVRGSVVYDVQAETVNMAGEELAWVPITAEIGEDADA